MTRSKSPLQPPETCPALYSLDASSEANGITWRFCSRPCRDSFAEMHADSENIGPFREGDEPTSEIPESWECDWCGEPVNDKEPYP